VYLLLFLDIAEKKEVASNLIDGQFRN